MRYTIAIVLTVIVFLMGFAQGDVRPWMKGTKMQVADETIRRYDLNAPTQRVLQLRMSVLAEPLAVTSSANGVKLYVREPVNVAVANLKMRTFEVYGTAEKVALQNLHYIGTFTLSDESATYHLFERLPVPAVNSALPGTPLSTNEIMTTVEGTVEEHLLPTDGGHLDVSLPVGSKPLAVRFEHKRLKLSVFVPKGSAILRSEKFLVVEVGERLQSQDLRFIGCAVSADGRLLFVFQRVTELKF